MGTVLWECRTLSRDQQGKPCQSRQVVSTWGLDQGQGLSCMAGQLPGQLWSREQAAEETEPDGTDAVL